jgi:predicted glycosyltransferase involved in capsule biosynthesis
MDMDKKLSIIVPYRNRYEHLKKFIREIPKALNNINFDITIVEQSDEKLFNRGKLLNVGFDYKRNVSDYFCFHDVDMIPLKADYSYSEKPYHMVTNAINQFKDGTYPGYYGGVNLFNKNDFIKINGYSNDYWGWGGEDDDLLKRVRSIGYDLYRREGVMDCLNDENHVTTYNNHDNYNNNVKKLSSNYDINKDGLSNLNYEILETSSLNDFTSLIKVKI